MSYFEIFTSLSALLILQPPLLPLYHSLSLHYPNLKPPSLFHSTQLSHSLKSLSLSPRSLSCSLTLSVPLSPPPPSLQLRQPAIRGHGGGPPRGDARQVGESVCACLGEWAWPRENVGLQKRAANAEGLMQLVCVGFWFRETRSV